MQRWTYIRRCSRDATHVHAAPHPSAALGCSTLPQRHSPAMPCCWPTHLQRLAVACIELALWAQEAWQQEVEQGPQFQHVVLDGRAAQNQPAQRHTALHTCSRVQCLPALLCTCIHATAPSASLLCSMQRMCKRALLPAPSSSAAAAAPACMRQRPARRRGGIGAKQRGGGGGRLLQGHAGFGFALRRQPGRRGAYDTARALGLENAAWARLGAQIPCACHAHQLRVLRTPEVHARTCGMPQRACMPAPSCSYGP